jgi:5-methylcytosine-specific restriction enzyme A
MNAFTHVPRKALSDRQKARLFEEREGRCHCCDRKLRPGDKWSVEHMIALSRGGTNEWANLALSCAGCKILKDGADAAGSAKAKRLSTKHNVPSPTRDERVPPKWPSRRLGVKYKPNVRDINDD